MPRLRPDGMLVVTGCTEASWAGTRDPQCLPSRGSAVYSSVTSWRRGPAGPTGGPWPLLTPLSGTWLSSHPPTARQAGGHRQSHAQERERFWEWVVVRPRGWLLLVMFSWAWGDRKTWARPDQGLGSQGGGGEAPQKPHSFPWSPWRIVQELSEAGEWGPTLPLGRPHSVNSPPSSFLLPPGRRMLPAPSAARRVTAALRLEERWGGPRGPLQQAPAGTRRSGGVQSRAG